MLDAKAAYDSAWSTQNQAYETQDLHKLQSLLTSVRANIETSESAANQISSDHQSTLEKLLFDLPSYFTTLTTNSKES